MSTQIPVPPDLPAHDDEFDGTAQTDQGVPVGEADVEADRKNAAGSDDSAERSTEDFVAESQQEMASDDGEAVGRADLAADRANGSASNDS